MIRARTPPYAVVHGSRHVVSGPGPTCALRLSCLLARIGRPGDRHVLGRGARGGQVTRKAAGEDGLSAPDFEQTVSLTVLPAARLTPDALPLTGPAAEVRSAPLAATAQQLCVVSGELCYGREEGLGAECVAQVRASLDSFGFGAGALVYLLGPLGRRL